MTNHVNYEVATRTMTRVVDWTTSPCKRESFTQFDVFFKNRRIAIATSLAESEEIILNHMAKHR